MKSRWPWVLLLAFSTASVHLRAAEHADHVVLIVWDGLRPDFVRPQYTPNLYEFASRGTFFKNNHSAFVTSTEVNGTALATGMQPDHSGVMANTEYRPDLNWLSSFGTESLDAVRRADLLSGGHYLETPTVPEILQAAGFPTVVAGAKPIALLQDRAPRKETDAQKKSVTLFRGQTLPRARLEALTRAPDIGQPPGLSFGTNLPAASAEPAATNAFGGGGGGGRRGGRAGTGGNPNSIDTWTTKALTRGLWRSVVPKYTVLWLSEPDAAQHASGLGSPEAVNALESSDENFGLVLKALEDKELLDQTDVFVVSDHGFSTISRGPDIVQALKRAKFTAGKQFDNPEAGDIMVVNLGGSTAFYVFDHDESIVQRLITFLQTSDFAGVIFAGINVEGVMPLSQAHIAPGKGAPDVMVSMRWTAELNDNGVPGMVPSSDGKRGSGTHASLSPFDLHNTLIAAGPHIKRGFVNELASGNIDVAPTALFLLGVAPPSPMDGRILSEALTVEAPAPPQPLHKTYEASRSLPLGRWHQYLKSTQVGYAVYYDEGNGEATVP